MTHSHSKIHSGQGICALTGAFGILSGFVLFLLWFVEGGHAEPGRFAMALLVATVVAYIIELLRERIEGHKEHEVEEAEGKNKRWDVLFARLTVSISIALIFELYVTAYHAVGEKLSSTSLTDAMNGVLGPHLSQALSPRLSLVAFLVIWVSLGAWLAWRLSSAIHFSGGFSQRGIDSAIAGGIAGGIGAPLIILGTVLITRSVAMAYWMLTDYHEWKLNLERLSRNQHLKMFVAPLLILTNALESCYSHGLLALAVGILILVVLSVAILKVPELSTKIGIYLAIAVLVLIMVPIVDNFRPIWSLAILTGLVWVAPGIWMGLLVPWLEHPTKTPRVWGFVCLAGAASLLAVTVFRLQFWQWCWAPAFVLTAASLLLGRVESAKTYWPYVALAMAAVLFGSTSLLQATFGSTLQHFHSALAIPLSVGKSTEIDDEDQRVFKEVERILLDEEQATRSRREQTDAAAPVEGTLHSSIQLSKTYLLGVHPRDPNYIRHRDIIERRHLADPNESALRKSQIKAAIHRRTAREAARAAQEQEIQVAREKTAAKLAELSPDVTAIDGPYWKNELQMIEEEIHRLKDWVENPKGGLHQKMELTTEYSDESDHQAHSVGHSAEIGHGQPPVKSIYEIEQSIQRVTNELSLMEQLNPNFPAALSQEGAEAVRKPNPSERVASEHRSRLNAAQETLTSIQMNLSNQVWRLLELALASSFGFWVTAGLLAAWADAEPHEKENGSGT